MKPENLSAMAADCSEESKQAPSWWVLYSQVYHHINELCYLELHQKWIITIMTAELCELPSVAPRRCSGFLWPCLRTIKEITIFRPRHFYWKNFPFLFFFLDCACKYMITHWNTSCLICKQFFCPFQSSTLLIPNLSTQDREEKLHCRFVFVFFQIIESFESQQWNRGPGWAGII